MAEEGSSKFRLVRCPKCGNIVHELPNFSVNKCGGCGSLLRARMKVTVNGGKERDGEGFEKLESLSEEEDGGTALDVEREKRDGILVDKGKDRIFKDGTLNSIDSSKKQMVGCQRVAEKGSSDCNAEYRVPLKQPIRSCTVQDDKEMNMKRSEPANSSREKVTGKISEQYKDPVGPLRSRATVGKWGLERNCLGMGNDGRRFSQFAPYPDEGPSNCSYMKSSSYAHGQLLKSSDERNRFAHLEQNRAELLRKLDELKEQISRSSMAEKQRDTSLVEANISSSGVPYNVPLQPLAGDMHGPRPSHCRQNGYEHISISSQDMDVENFYFYQRGNVNEFSVHRDHMKWQTPMLDPYDYHLGADMDFVPEHLASYSHQTPYHEPVCGCHHCYNKKWHVSSQFPVAISTNKHFREGPINSNFKHNVGPMICGSQNSHPQVNHHSLHPRFPKPHALCPSDVDSGMDVLRKSRPRRVGFAHGNRRFCHPIAGGSPFIVCYCCFELLKLQRNPKKRDNYQQRLRCGACSTVLLVEIRNKQLTISMGVKNKQMAAEPNDGPPEVARKVLLPTGGNFSPEKTDLVDFGNLGHDHQPVEFSKDVLPENQRLNSNKPTTRDVPSSQSSFSSEEQAITDSMIVQRDASDFLVLNSEGKASPTFSRSPLPEDLDGTSSNHKINKNGEGNQSNRADKGKFLFDHGSAQNSVNKVSSETEIEDSFGEFPNTTTSQDSLQTSKEHGLPMIRKGSDSFLAGILKKSLKDYSRSNQHGEYEKADVFVNGKPIPHGTVIMAEKLAGPIQPGDYWYDSQAGFWGVMGLHCLGIIPPWIKEFNYPMPENCSCGNTSVFVNGRELHQKDLDLLSSRGLPTTKEKSYRIDMSGSVFDKDSGKELKGLGKLAPTVEKVKRGFGMKTPRSLHA